jgi:hypothetical protein
MKLFHAISIMSLMVLAAADMSLAAERPPSLGNGRAVIIAQAMPGQTNRMGPGMGGQMPQQMPGPMMGDSAGGPMMGMMGMGGMMGDHVEGRIAFLKTELKITEAQTPQWTAFSDTLRANAQRVSEMRNTMMQGGMMGPGSAAMKAPDRLDRMETMMATMVESLKATKAALAPLYAVLTDDQKKMADQLIHGPMGMGRM